MDPTRTATRALPAALGLALIPLGVLAGCRSTDELSGVKTQLFDSPDTYELEFAGVRSLSTGLLQRAAAADLEDFEAGGFRAAPIDDAAYAIENFYRGRGFPFAEVDYELDALPGQRPLVRFEVVEGPRCIVGSVSTRGQQAFTSDELADLLGGPTTQVFGLGRVYYVKTEAEAARAAMEDLYSQSGYLDVRVLGPEVTFDSARERADLVYEVIEGPRYLLRVVAVEPLADHETATVEEHLQTFVGRAYFPRIVQELRSAAAERFAERGYPDAQASAVETVDPQVGDVEVELALEPGPQVSILEIVVEGNEATRESFILSVLGMEAGELYRRSAERRAFRRLYATGLFKSISIDLLGDGAQRRLRVRVEEAETLSLSTEVGYGSFERARVLIALTQANLFGTGRSLQFEGKLAERARGANLVFTDPYTLDEDNVLGMTVFVEEREQVSFDSLEFGSGVSLTRHLTDNYRNVYGYEYRVSESSNVGVSIPSLDPELQEDAYISALYLTNVYDSRESFFLPRDGTWLRVRTEFAPEALGSDLNFVRLDGRVVRYHPFDDQNLLAWTVRGGVIFPMGGTSVIPLQERFYNGGQNTVRSFREDELGPTDANDTPVGGEAYSVFSLEYRRGLFGSLSAALFVDAGNVAFEHQDALRFADLRYGVGPGLRWMLPVGPLRLDWGINPNPRPNEADWALQFSLGVAF
jgi:outer membrane protein assembly complex protein YaeT